MYWRAICKDRDGRVVDKFESATLPVLLQSLWNINEVHGGSVVTIRITWVD